jgi:hypothetical protein
MLLERKQTKNGMSQWMLIKKALKKEDAHIANDYSSGPLTPIAGLIHGRQRCFKPQSWYKPQLSGRHSNRLDGSVKNQ